MFRFEEAERLSKILVGFRLGEGFEKEGDEEEENQNVRSF